MIKNIAMAANNQVILLISNDKVGTEMAGPGIRYFELAKALAKFTKVRLLVPDSTDIKSTDFEIITYSSKSSSKSIASNLDNASWVMAQSLRPPLMKRIKRQKIKFIADLYDPLTIETLEYTKFDSRQLQEATFDFNQAVLNLQLFGADHILCASKRQQDFYTGVLSSLKIINPRLYSETPDLNKLVTIAPFGLSQDKIPAANYAFLQEKFPAIKESDKIVYWGGGVWDWFDPLSVIKAIEKIAIERDDIKLLFVGLKHPNPKIKAMKRAEEAVNYAKEKGLIDKSVFFNFGWTPYDERKNYLASAMVGISTHFESLETRLSFRTRMLDYLWAEIPIIATEGDSFAELIANKSLGQVVPYNDMESIKEAIISIIDNKTLREKMSENIRLVKQDFLWDKIAADIWRVIGENKSLEPELGFAKFLRLTAAFYWAGLKKKMAK